MASENYRKPPVQYQFKKGQSGNPDGRPKKKPEVIPPGTQGGIFDRLAGMALEEANRPITVREGDRVEQLPAIQAVMRSMFRSAAQGDPRAQRKLLELVGRAEIDRAAAARETATFLLELQAKGQEVLTKHERHSLDQPEIYPHPDDIDFDMGTGEVNIDGPISKEQAGAQRIAEDQAVSGVRRYFEIEEQLKKDPKNRALKKELAQNKVYLEFLQKLGSRNLRRRGLEMARQAMKHRATQRTKSQAATKNKGPKSGNTQ
jgi:hypothetical protein